MFKRIVLTLIGMNILAFGISLTLLSNLGAGALDSFHNAFANLIGVSFGYGVIIFGFILLSIVIISTKEYKSLFSLIPLFFLGNLINLFLHIIPLTDDIIIRIIYILLGIIFIGLGAAFMIISDLAPSVPDKFVLFMQEKLNIKTFTVAKYIFEVVMLLLSVSIGLLFLDGVEQLGIGTIIMTLGVGYVVQFFLNILNKFIIIE